MAAVALLAGARALGGLAALYACIAALALFLQTKAAKVYSTRVCVSCLIVAVMLVCGPLLYRQHSMAVALAGTAGAIALSMLDWALLRADVAPPVWPGVASRKLAAFLGLYASVLQHTAWGVCGAQKRKQERLAAQRSAAAAAEAPAGRQPPSSTSSSSDSGCASSGDGSASASTQHAAASCEDPVLCASRWQLARRLAAVLVAQDALITVLQCAGLPCIRSTAGLPLAARYALTTAGGVLLAAQMNWAYRIVRLLLALCGARSLAAALPPSMFDSLAASTSASEMWGRRWHQMLRFYFTGLGHALAGLAMAPLVWLLPRRALAALTPLARLLAAFLLSGLLHEYMVWAAFGTVSGRQLAFFMLHGAAVGAETLAARALPRASAAVPAWLKWAGTMAFVAATGPLFVEDYFEGGFFHHMLHPAGRALGTRLVAPAGLCGHPCLV